jgi:hypothetical protein
MQSKRNGLSRSGKPQRAAADEIVITEAPRSIGG